ncbi:cysteine--tRNA ligase [Blattabacterium cuenoti]|uniref:cysteine--tRNA ligase n=1 Tax=Blattabacterium cuenoti TaxID=1653831 RepID=UPI00163C5AAD|nr:cysteine--tRNA ligase [Blattabacterium cuenoti]
MNIINYRHQHNIKIYNSLTGTKELFIPLNKKYIGIYVCGPTVYNYIHLGNCRTFILFDFIVRYFKHLNYKIRYVRNITDVGHLEENDEDKISIRSRIEGLEPMELVQKYTIFFHKILQLFNLLPPNIEPIATGHIIEQIDIITQLLNNNIAYEKNGSVYFNIEKYNQEFSDLYGPYGSLSNNDINQLINKNYHFLTEKKKFHDFALWKKAKYNHIMYWNSPWGKGFPGWHIECTTMSTKYLGTHFDIHGGGIDLKFPHHECEIAQAIGINKKMLSRYWIHTNILTYQGKKMSKSKGNVVDINNLLNNNKFHPTIIRYYLLTYHYRSILNFSEQGIKNSEKGYLKLMRTINIIDKILHTTTTTTTTTTTHTHHTIPIHSNNNTNTLNFDILQWIKDCYYAIDDDFNTPLLISHLFKIYKITHCDYIYNIKLSDIHLLKMYMHYFLFDIMGLEMMNKQNLDKTSKNIHKIIEFLIELRIEERIKKNWIVSDKIRYLLSLIGIKLQDKKIN